MNNFWKNKRVFLTGHTGFKGTWMATWLHEMGANVYGFSLAPLSNDSLYDLSKLDEKINSTIGDIRDLASLKASIKIANPDIVIHMAAQALVRASYDDPIETYSTNVMGTVNILEACRSCSNLKAILNVTTDKVYENKEWVWAYRENDTLGGYDPYSNSKACSELVTQSYRDSFFNPKDYGTKHNVSVASARAGNVIGGGDWSTDRLIPDLFRAYKNNQELSLRNPNSIRPWQHVMEAIRGYLILSEKLFSNGIDYASSWNFGPGEESYLNVGELVKYIVDEKKVMVRVSFDQNPNVHEARLLKLDWSKSSESLGWKPLWNIQTTLDHITHFYLASLDQKFDAYAEIVNSIKEYEKKIV